MASIVRKRLGFFLGFVFLLGLMLAIAWLTGGITLALLALAEHHLPYRVDRELVITRVEHGDPTVNPPADRVRLTISRSRLRQALREAGDWHRVVPPGLLSDGLVIGGEWTPYSRGEKVDITIPVEIRVDDTEGDHPHLEGSLPVAMLNAYMEVEFAEDFVNEDEEYVLGHFDYTFRPTILEATIRTTNNPSLPPAAYVEQIGLEVKAEGTVRLKFEENLFRASTTARISELLLLITVTPTPTAEGVVLDYDAKFRTLRGNVRKLHNYGDKKVSDKLKSKWTRSLNREKRKQKLARHALPPWAPMDVVIDLSFYREEKPGG